MPLPIIFLVAAAPILALFMISGANWSRETVAAATLALAAAIIIVVVWIFVGAVRALLDRWRRFTSRPY